MWVENIGSFYFPTELGDKVVGGRRLKESEATVSELGEGHLTKYVHVQWLLRRTWGLLWGIFLGSFFVVVFVMIFPPPPFYEL